MEGGAGYLDEVCGSYSGLRRRVEHLIALAENAGSFLNEPVIERPANPADDNTDFFPNAATMASGLRVPAAVGDFLMIDAVRASGGTARTGREATIPEWMARASAAEGIGICPETAVCFDVLTAMGKAGEMKPDDEVLVFNTGAATKYMESRPASLARLDKNAIDRSKFS